MQSDSQIETKLKSELGETWFPNNNLDEKMSLAIKTEYSGIKSEHPDVKPECITIENMESRNEIKHVKKRKCNKQSKNNFACLQRLLTTANYYKMYKKPKQQSGDNADDCFDSDTSQSNESCALCIRNFPKSWTYEQIKHYIAKECGSVESTSILDGTVVVTFEDSEKCKMAMQSLHHKEVGGEKLVAKFFADNEGDSENETDSEASLSTKKRKLDTTSQKPSIDSYESDFEGLYGLKHEYLRSLGMTPPLHKWIYVSGFKCDKAELRDIFELAGTVLLCHVIASETSKYARIMYAHPLEAVQAVSMFNGQNCLGEELTVYMTMPAEDDLNPKSLAAMGPGLGINGQPLKDVIGHYEKYVAGKKCLINYDLFLPVKLKDDSQNSATNEIAERDITKKFFKVGISTQQLLELLELVASRHREKTLSAENVHNIESENSEKDKAASKRVSLQNESKHSPTTSFAFQAKESLHEQSVDTDNSKKSDKYDLAQNIETIEQASNSVSIHSNVPTTVFGNFKWGTSERTDANGSSVSGHMSDRCGSMFRPGNSQTNPSQDTIFGSGNHVTGSTASMSGSDYVRGSSVFLSDPSNSMPGSNNIMPGPSGPMYCPSGSMDSASGPMYGTTGPMHGPRGPISGPSYPMPRPSGSMHNSSRPMASGPMHGPVGTMVGVNGLISGPNGPVLGPSGPMPCSGGHISAPGGHMIGTNTQMYGSSGHLSGPSGTIAGPGGNMVSQGVSMPGPGYISGQRDVYPGQVMPTQGSSMCGANGHMVGPMQSGFMQNPTGAMHSSCGNVGPMANLRGPVGPRPNHSGPNPYMYTPNSGTTGPRPGFTPIKMIKGSEPVTIIISNMPKTASFSELLEKFSQFGEVTSLQLVAPNSATVKFAHPSMADRCLDDFNKTYRDGSIADKPIN